MSTTHSGPNMANQPAVIPPTAMNASNSSRSGSSSIIERFPLEILLMIKDNLNDVDALNLRAASRTLHMSLTERIFSRVEVSYLPSSFKNLLKISSSPSLNKYVTELVYLAEDYTQMSRKNWEKRVRFPSDTKKRPLYPIIPQVSAMTSQFLEDHSAEVLRWVEACRPVSFYTEAELAAGYKVYSNASNAQSILKTNYADMASLVESFSYLKNLKSVVAMINPFADHEDASRKLSRTSDLRGRSPTWVQSKEATLNTIRKGSSLLISIISARCKLNSLRICQIPWSVIEEHFGRAIQVGAFVHLKKLTLDISDVSDSDDPTLGQPQHEQRQNLLGQAIRSAKGLEYLNLKFWSYEANHLEGTLDREENEPIRWSRIIGNSVFSALQELIIVGMDMEPSWLDFFSHHPHLQHLTIREPFLLERKSWVSTLEKFKEVAPPALKTLALEGEFWWNFEDPTRTETQSLDMEKGLGQLIGPWETEDRGHPDRFKGVMALLEGEEDLGQLIWKWIRNLRPSPFVKTR